MRITDSAPIAVAPGEALQGATQARIALGVREILEFHRRGGGHALGGALPRRNRGGRWRPHDDAKLCGRVRTFGAACGRCEQLRLTEAQLRGQSLVLHEQSEFGVGMTNDVTVAREGRRKQGADALLQCRQAASTSQDGRESARVAAPGAVAGEQFLRADGPVRATIQ